MTPNEIRLGDLLAAHFCDPLTAAERTRNDTEIERLRALDSDPDIRDSHFWWDVQRRWHASEVQS